MNILPYSGFPALPKNIEDMHNQLVTLGLNDVEALTARIKKCEDWVDTVEETELTGNPVEFQNALALPAKSLVTTINAIQDLHGYDHPWAGGAGKNKCPYFTGSTVAGITYTVGTDGKVGFSGTPSAPSEIRQDVALKAGTYIVSGAPTGSVLGSKDIYVQLSGTTVARSYDGVTESASTFTLSEDSTVRINLRAASSALETAISGTYEPMIRPSTESAGYAPYSNICPISGRTAVVITRSDGDEISEDFTIQLGQTVYGADINWDTGVATVTHVIKTFTGADAESWSKSAITDIDIYIAPVSDGDLSKAFISNAYACYTTQNRNRIGEMWLGTSNTQLRLGFAEHDASTLTSFKTWLSNNNVQLCCKLATPTTIQLTPEELEMLKGYNRITLSDGYGTIELKALTGANWS